VGILLKVSETRNNIKRDLLIATALTLIGVLTRLPYLALIPVFEDEALQTVYALSIRPGEFLPLVGNDPYAGPLFSYILAVSMRVFASPVTPRVVAMLMGALTVGLVYLLARALSLAWPWAALASLLMAANPHHILINSHYAGTTYVLPLFSTAFLLALTLAVKRGSGLWLVAAGALLGLALQTNPVPLLMLPGVAVWFLIQRKANIGLRTRWPYLAAAAFLVAYAPVILYNLQTGLAGVSAAELGRSYLWQPNPAPAAFAQNLWRLTLQLCRQASGVLEGDETLRSLLGMPLLLCAWAIVGLIYAARQGLTLPALAVGSQLLIMPWLSNHYGLTGTTRFTNQLTPLIFVAMAAMAASVWKLVQVRSQSSAIVLRSASCILLVAISLWPLTSLFRYYGHKVAAGETNAPYFAFADEFTQEWRGERVFLSDSPDVPQAVEYLLTIKAVPYTRLPLGRIMEQLATGQETGRVTLILTNDDRSQAQVQAGMTVWDSPAMQDANKQGYSVVTIADAQQVHKPSFVLTGTSALAPTARAIQVIFAEGLSMVGYEVKPNSVNAGEQFVVNIYWQATRAMPEAYTGFVHLIGPDGQLATQDDHELGRGFYRTIFWQPDEVIREKYVLTAPQSPDDYVLWAGAYDFPWLKRLTVLSAGKPTQDNRIMLDTIPVGP
jgi:uncharacterized membrane protein (Fun14 family)